MRTFVDGELLTAANLNANFTELSAAIAAATSDSGWLTTGTVISAYSDRSSVEYRVIAGIVYLRGFIQPNTGSIAVGSYSNIATMPAVARPGVTLKFPVNGVILGSTVVNTPRGTIAINSTGALDMSAETALTQITLDGISYPIG